MAIITLTTDMGVKDYYVAAVKGAIFSQLDDVKIVDVSHNILPFDIAQASFVLKNVYHEFPRGTVHIIGVNPDTYKELSDSTKNIAHIVVEHEGHFFIGADNGIFSLLFDQTPEHIFELNLSHATNDLTFPVKNVFAKAACYLLKKGCINEMGRKKDDVRQAALYQPVVEGDIIRGMVIYVDSYGNVITNITRKLFDQVAKERNFSIYFRREDYEIRKIDKTFNAVPEGEKVALFNSAGNLMLAINRGVEGSGGGASSLFGLHLTDIVRIEFDVPPSNLSEL